MEFNGTAFICGLVFGAVVALIVILLRHFLR